MATGPEHYREAERFIKIAVEAEERLQSTDVLPELRLQIVGTAYARAQVHATLALAAATAMGLRSTLGGVPNPQDTGSPAGMWPADFRAWDTVAGVPSE